MIAPDPDAEYVKRFCRMISSCEPLSVPLRPIADAPLNECFDVVPKHVAAYGGKAVTGWAIWEWPGVLIEAEFHACWQTKEGVIIDLTPKLKAFESITFLPDPKKIYRGRQVDNIRKPLTNSLLVKKFIEAARKRFLVLNEGDLANQHGEIEATPEMIKLEYRMIELRDKIVAKYGGDAHSD